MASASSIPDVDCFVFAGRESNWLGSSIESVLRAAEFAETNGIHVQLKLILWSARPETRKWVSERVDRRWDVVDLPDCTLSEARNNARLRAGGQCVVFLDGSDMVGKNWFSDSFREAITKPGIYRPEALITFGPDSFSPGGFDFILQQETESFELLLGKENPLPSGFTTRIEILRSVPWPSEDTQKGWSEVDWWWNCLAAAGGHSHYIIRECAHYRRMSVRAGSVGNVLERPGPVVRVRCHMQEGVNPKI